MDRKRLDNTIRQHEGMKLKAYRDSRGIWTIGIGHNLESDPAMQYIIEGLRQGEYPDGYIITEDTALNWFRRDLDNAIVGTQALFPGWNVFTDRQQESLIEMVFQLGPGGVANFHNMMQAINTDPPNWGLAAIEGLDSEWHRRDSPKRAVEVVKGFLA